MKRHFVAGLILAVAGAALFAQDFRKDEVLCGASEESPLEAEYAVAKVLKAASAETKDQHQVLYVRDGAKAWVDFVVPSHKAKKTEMKVEALVFYPQGWAEYEEMSADDYRKATWGLGLITDTGELFKDLVEIEGSKYYWKLLRVPDYPEALEFGGE